MLLTTILLAFVLGFCANVYRNILAYEPILNWWFKIGEAHEDKWYHKPIWGCVLCISGQWALWYWIFSVILFKFYAGGTIILSANTNLFLIINPLEGLILILTTIGASFIFNKYIFD